MFDVAHKEREKGGNKKQARNINKHLEQGCCTGEIF
jgi:hypothetical protein